MGIKEKRHKITGNSAGSQPPPSQPRSLLCAGVQCWSCSPADRGAKEQWVLRRGCTSFCRSEGCKCRLWLKWGCLDRCILSLPIFLLLKQKELRDAKIQRPSKYFSFYFPWNQEYAHSVLWLWDLGGAAVTEAPALKRQATDPKNYCLGWYRGSSSCAAQNPGQLWVIKRADYLKQAGFPPSKKCPPSCSWKPLM